MGMVYYAGSSCDIGNQSQNCQGSLWLLCLDKWRDDWFSKPHCNHVFFFKYLPICVFDSFDQSHQVGMRLAGENRKHDKNFKFSLLRSSKSICILASQRYTGLITTIVIEATDIWGTWVKRGAFLEFDLRKKRGDWKMHHFSPDFLLVKKFPPVTFFS